MIVEAGALNVAPLAGLVIATVGGWCTLTVTDTAAEVADAPRLLVATAVRL
jgi:hypothetical protein